MVLATFSGCLHGQVITHFGCGSTIQGDQALANKALHEDLNQGIHRIAIINPMSILNMVLGWLSGCETWTGEFAS